ncbi:MAG: glycohydrolase toxin TNT-related protein, partial [Mycoplasmatales bacterium]
LYKMQGTRLIEKILYTTNEKSSRVEEVNGTYLKTKLEYDKYGNAIKKTYSNGLIETFKYNGADELTNISSNKGTNVSYTYDMFGNRMSSNDTKYVLDYTQKHTKLLATYKGTTQTNAYVYDQFEQLKSNSQNYYDVDGNNNVIGQLAKTNPTGYTKQVTYDNHGKPSINLENEFGYRSEMHTAGNQQYLRFREYDTSIGAFTKRDTYPGVQDRINSQNRYIYAENDPINGSDPSGHAMEMTEGGGGGGRKHTCKTNPNYGSWDYRGPERVCNNKGPNGSNYPTHSNNYLNQPRPRPSQNMQRPGPSYNYSSGYNNNSNNNSSTSQEQKQKKYALEREFQATKEIESIIKNDSTGYYKSIFDGLKAKGWLSIFMIAEILKFCQAQGYGKFDPNDIDGIIDAYGKNGTSGVMGILDIIAFAGTLFGIIFSDTVIDSINYTISFFLLPEEIEIYRIALFTPFVTGSTVKIINFFSKDKKLLGKVTKNGVEIIEEFPGANKLEKWNNSGTKYLPDKALYLEKKNVYDNPKYYDQSTGMTKWPPNDGAVAGTEFTRILQPGEFIDRYGDASGRYTSPLGTQYGQRSLAPGSNKKGYHRYKVIEPFEVNGAKVAPWFDEPGGGIQYMSKQTINELVHSGKIKEIK